MNEVNPFDRLELILEKRLQLDDKHIAKQLIVQISHLFQQLKQQLQETRQSLSIASQAVFDKETQIKSLQRDIGFKTEIITSLEQKIEKLQNSHTEQELTAQKQKQLTQLVNNDLAQQNNKIKQQLDALQQQYQELLQKSAQDQKSNESTILIQKQQLAEFKQQINQLNLKLSTQQDAQYLHQKQEIAAQSEKLEQFLAETVSIKQENVQLKEKLAQLQVQRSQATDLHKRKLQELLKEYSLSQQEVERLQNTLDNIEQQNAVKSESIVQQNVEMNARIQQLTLEVATTRSKLYNTEQKLSMIESKNEQLKLQLKEMTNKKQYRSTLSRDASRSPSEPFETTLTINESQGERRKVEFELNETIIGLQAQIIGQQNEILRLKSILKSHGVQQPLKQPQKTQK